MFWHRNEARYISRNYKLSCHLPALNKQDTNLEQFLIIRNKYNFIVVIINVLKILRVSASFYNTKTPRG